MKVNSNDDIIIGKDFVDLFCLLLFLSCKKVDRQKGSDAHNLAEKLRPFNLLDMHPGIRLLFIKKASAQTFEGFFFFLDQKNLAEKLRSFNLLDMHPGIRLLFIKKVSECPS